MGASEERHCGSKFTSDKRFTVTEKPIRRSHNEPPFLACGGYVGQWFNPSLFRSRTFHLPEHISWLTFALKSARLGTYSVHTAYNLCSFHVRDGWRPGHFIHRPLLYVATRLFRLSLSSGCPPGDDFRRPGWRVDILVGRDTRQGEETPPRRHCTAGSSRRRFWGYYPIPGVGPNP